jgi:hypothetical protein
MGRTLITLEDVRAKRRYKDAIIIDNWEHLRDWYKENGPSETHEIVFNEYSARIQSRRENPLYGIRSYRGFHYLSTHTFYGKGMWVNSTEALYKAGFKGIIIRNWDAKEENQEWPELTWKAENY